MVAHPEVRVDLPVAALLPEEYLPDVDERVRYYRRLAGAPSVEGVASVAADLVDKYGALPEVARNLVDIARIKAIAADAGVKTVAVVRNRLMVSPVQLDDEGLGRMAALGAVHMERKKQLTLPLGYGESVTSAAIGLLCAIYSRQS